MRVCVHRGLNCCRLTATRKKVDKSSGYFTILTIVSLFITLMHLLDYSFPYTLPSHNECRNNLHLPITISIANINVPFHIEQLRSPIHWRKCCFSIWQILLQGQVNGQQLETEGGRGKMRRLICLITVMALILVAGVAWAGEPNGIPISVPEPSTLLLLGSGLAGLIGFGRRRMKK